jgi:Fe-S-cluster-containing hydrogenase component 2
MLYTHSGECANCSGCEPVCPAGAIVCEDDVPGQWTRFTTENVRFFAQPGSPGGAAKTGPLPDDTDHVASYVTSR